MNPKKYGRNKGFIAALVIEVALFIFGLSSMAEDSSQPLGTGWQWASALVWPFVIPATLIAWFIDYRIDKKYLAVDKPSVIDPNWNKKKRAMWALLVGFVAASFIDWIFFQGS